MIITSRYQDVTLPSNRLTDHVLERARALGDKTAIIDGSSGASISYSALEKAVRGLAGGLVAHGFRKDDVVALVAPNSPEYAIAFHALSLAGAIVTTVNPSYSELEIRHQLLDSGAVRVVTTVDRLPVVAAAGEGSSRAPSLFVLDDRERQDSLWRLSGERLEIGVGTSVEDVAVLPYSSGTTGASKGVMLSHANMTTNIEQSLAALRLVQDDTIMAVLPMFHIYGMQVVLNCSLRVGATVVTMPRFELTSFLQVHERYGVSRSFVVPPIVLMLAQHSVVSGYDLSKLQQISAVQRLCPKRQRRWRRPASDARSFRDTA